MRALAWLHLCAPVAPGEAGHVGVAAKEECDTQAQVICRRQAGGELCVLCMVCRAAANQAQLAWPAGSMQGCRWHCGGWCCAGEALLLCWHASQQRLCSTCARTFGDGAAAVVAEAHVLRPLALRSA